MKTLHIASILLVVGMTAFACNDNEDGIEPHAAAGAAGKANTAGNANGTAGSNDDADRGGGGSPPDIVDGVAGTHEGGAGGAGGNADSEHEAGASGTAGASGESMTVEPLELIGDYDETFGGHFSITEDSWGSSAIAAYDNATNAVYTRFPADDLYNPNKFAKILYTEPANDAFYYCLVVYSAATLAEAQESDATADPSDPDHGGCGGQFPWSKATKS